MSPRYVGCWLCPSGSELLPSKVTSVRVMFFGEKRLPPFLTVRCLRVTSVGGSSGARFPSFCWPSKGNLFTDDAMCANFVFWKKMSPPFLARCCLEGLSSS